MGSSDVHAENLKGQPVLYGTLPGRLTETLQTVCTCTEKKKNT